MLNRVQSRMMGLEASMNKVAFCGDPNEMRFCIVFRLFIFPPFHLSFFHSTVTYQITSRVPTIDALFLLLQEEDTGPGPIISFSSPKSYIDHVNQIEQTNGEITHSISLLSCIMARFFA